MSRIVPEYSRFAQSPGTLKSGSFRFLSMCSGLPWRDFTIQRDEFPCATDHERYLLACNSHEPRWISQRHRVQNYVRHGCDSEHVYSTRFETAAADCPIGNIRSLFVLILS